MAFRLNWFPRGSRFAVLCAAIILVSLCFTMLFLIADNLSGSFLGAFGKDATLTGRTEIWAQARVAWDENPILGVGYQQFWVLAIRMRRKSGSDFNLAAQDSISTTFGMKWEYNLVTSAGLL